MLLSITGLAAFGILNVNAPNYGAAAARRSPRSRDKPKLLLTVLISKKGFYVAATGRRAGAAAGGSPARRARARRRIPKKADGTLRLRRADRAKMNEIKAAFPAESKVIVGAEARHPVRGAGADHGRDPRDAGQGPQAALPRRHPGSDVMAGARPRRAAASSTKTTLQRHEVPQGAGAQEAQGARGRRRDQRAQHHRDDGHDDHHPGVPPQVLRRLGRLDDPSRGHEAAHLHHPRDAQGHGGGDHHAEAHPGGRQGGGRRSQNGQMPPRTCSTGAWWCRWTGAEEGGGEAEAHRRRATRPRRSATSCRSSATGGFRTTCS